jgi:hypothetical protein
MDKAEALDFIGLKEPLTEEIVRNKYIERFNYYHMLYANAPNKVIEKIQQQNLEKLNRIKGILLEEITTKKTAFNKRFLDIAVEEKPAAVHTEKQVAWLIVHTENKKTETFDLFEGINYIGRKKKEDGAVSIVLQDDPFVSRTHAFIKIKRIKGNLQFALYDGDGGKPSINGVFLNGKEGRINQHCSLVENDTIQIGATKLVFKIKKEDKSITGEIEEVMKTGFIRTININS